MKLKTSRSKFLFWIRNFEKGLSLISNLNLDPKSITHETDFIIRTKNGLERMCLKLELDFDISMQVDVKCLLQLLIKFEVALDPS